MSAADEPGVCHSAGGEEAARRRPWATDSRADAKDALFDYVAEHAYGVPIIHAVRTVLDADTDAGDADHRLALRFFTEDYAYLFKTTRSDGIIQVKPQPWAVLLKSSRQAAPQTPLGDASRASGSLPRRAPSGRAAATARSVLRDRCQITPDGRGGGVRAALTHALAAHRQGVDSDGMRSDRVSSPSRVAARQATYLGAFEAAARRHSEGTLVTLTARPGESGDMVDTAVAVNESVGPLRKWLGRQTPGEGASDVVVVREVTGRGVLHIHVLAFGRGPEAFDREALSRYWRGTRGHGYIVDVSPIESRPVRTPRGRERRWVFADHADAPTERGRYVRAYLGEMLFKFREVAESSPEELHGGEVAGAWQVALLWACGLPVVSVSSGLRHTGRSPSPSPPPSRSGAWSARAFRRALSAVGRVVAVVWRDRPPPRGGTA